MGYDHVYDEVDDHSNVSIAFWLHVNPTNIKSLVHDSHPPFIRHEDH